MNVLKRLGEVFLYHAETPPYPEGELPMAGVPAISEAGRQELLAFAERAERELADDIARDGLARAADLYMSNPNNRML